MLGFQVRISHCPLLPCQPQKAEARPSCPPPCVRTTSRVHLCRRSTRYQTARGAECRSPDPPWAPSGLAEGERSLRRRLTDLLLGCQRPLCSCFSVSRLLAPTPAFISVPEFFLVSLATFTPATEFPTTTKKNKKTLIRSSSRTTPCRSQPFSARQTSGCLSPALHRNEDSRAPSSKVQKPKQLASAR